MKKTQLAKSKKWQRKKAKQTRSRSEINYTHWWRTHPVWKEETALSLDEQKAAIFYEAYRRVPEIRDAWLKGIRGPEVAYRLGWQSFVAVVLIHLPKTWLELGSAKNFLCQNLAEMLPPVGYSVWPAQPEFRKKKQELTPDELKRLEAYHERCRKLTAKIPVIPPLTEQHALSFLKEIRKLSDAGFVVVAIDNKSRETFNYGIQFLQRRLKDRRSFRAADIYYKFPQQKQPPPLLPDDEYTWEKVSKLSQAERNSLAWRMAEQTETLHAECRAIGKRRKKRKGQADVIPHEKIFEFQKLCEELESFDETGEPSDLMRRLRW